MAAQAAAFGPAELSRAADVANTALTEMTGATSPRLHLELMVARLLVPASDDSERGALARVERLERRVGIEDSPRAEERREATRLETPQEAPPARVEERREATRRETPAPPEKPAASSPLNPVTAQQLRDAWPEVLEALQKSAGRRPWAVVSTTTVHAFADDVLTLGFVNESDVANFRPSPGTPPGESVSEQLRTAIADVLGVRVKFLPRVEPAAASQAATVEPEAPPAREPEPAAVEPEPAAVEPEPAAAEATASGWDVVEIPDSSPVEPVEQPAPEPEPEQAPAITHPAGDARYGEAVVREILGANFLEETSTAPRDRPVPLTSDAAEE
jgi:DNA polymerase-3 subunit gamma/tau